MTELSPEPKRQRLSLALVDPQESGLARNLPQESNTDIIQYFAQRGGRAAQLERENATLKDSHAKLKLALKAAETDAESSQEQIRLQTQKYETCKQLLKEEQQEVEMQYKKEIHKAADSQKSLEASQKSQAAASERAQKAEEKLAEIRVEFRKEQLIVQAKLQKLDNELRAAKMDAKLRERPQHTDPQLSPQALKVLQKQVQELEGRLREEAGQRRSLENELAKELQRAAKAEAALTQAEISGNEANAELIRSLRKELNSQEADIIEARKIKEKVQSLTIMRERVYAAEARAARAEKLQSDELELKANITFLQQQLRAWEMSCHDVGVDSPASVPKRLKAMQQECLEASQKLGEKDAELRVLTDELARAEGRKAEAEAAFHEMQSLQTENAASAAKFERKAAILEKERDGLQKVLASYEEEEKANLPMSAAQSAHAIAIANEKLMVESLKAQNNKLEENTLQAASATSQLNKQLSEALTKIVELESDKRQLQQDIEGLEEQTHHLQNRLDKGEFNPETTKVLHCIVNPEAEARQELQLSRIADLEAEVAALKMQSSLDDTNKEQGTENLSAAQTAKILILEQKVADLLKRETRLKDVFQKNVTNFREAVFCLFGYRVDMATEAQASENSQKGDATFVLRPQFGEGNRMQLMFCFRKGKMELLPTDYTEQKLKREVETFIGRFKCIPAFTANWTMELFQKQTLA